MLLPSSGDWSGAVVSNADHVILHASRRVTGSPVYKFVWPTVSAVPAVDIDLSPLSPSFHSQFYSIERPKICFAGYQRQEMAKSLTDFKIVRASIAHSNHLP